MDQLERLILAAAAKMKDIRLRQRSLAHDAVRRCTSPTRLDIEASHAVTDREPGAGHS